MWSDLAQAWALFGDAWLTGLLLALQLPFAGIVLVARQQLFLSAAMGQAATLGIAAVLRVEAASGHAAPSHRHAEEAAAVAAAALGAVATAVAALGSRGRDDARQADAVWVFLAAGSGAVLLLTHAPHGLAEVHRLVLSSLVGASRADVWIAAGALAAILAGFAVHRERLMLWALDHVTATALGLPVRRYRIACGVAIGLLTGFAIHSAGLLFTFGATVLPVLIARDLARRLVTVCWLAPLVSVALMAVALVASHLADYPPGQMAVGLMALAAAAARAVRRLASGAAA
jgi:ABC-type Mn2+/Zn2+ transport system permease subunit